MLLGENDTSCGWGQEGCCSPSEANSDGQSEEGILRGVNGVVGRVARLVRHADGMNATLLQ